MQRLSDPNPNLLLMVAGAKGAIGSTLATMVAALQTSPQLVVPYLTTVDKFPFLGACGAVAMVGWDRSSGEIADAVSRHGVLPEGVWRPHEKNIEAIKLLAAPEPTGLFEGHVSRLKEDIQCFREDFPGARPVLINLLPVYSTGRTDSEKHDPQRGAEAVSRGNGQGHPPSQGAGR